jgi:hypothetical protein
MTKRKVLTKRILKQQLKTNYILAQCILHGKQGSMFCMRYGIDRPVTQAAVVPEEVMSQVEPLSKSSFC